MLKNIYKKETFVTSRKSYESERIVKYNSYKELIEQEVYIERSIFEMRYCEDEVNYVRILTRPMKSVKINKGSSLFTLIDDYYKGRARRAKREEKVRKEEEFELMKELLNYSLREEVDLILKRLGKDYIYYGDSYIYIEREREKEKENEERESKYTIDFSFELIGSKDIRYMEEKHENIKKYQKSIGI